MLYEGKIWLGTGEHPVCLLPQMANRPGQVWRAAPSMGMDNEEILGELGYSEEEIARLYENGVINKRPVEDFRQ